MASKNHKPADQPDVEQPFIAHLVELRDRLLRCVIAVLVVFLCLAPFTNQLYTFVAGPLIKHMPANGSMIATEVASPFFTPVKLTLVIAVFIAIPVLLHQAWAFVAPGLYRRERLLALPLLISSTILFYLGMAFAYYAVFPLVFAYMNSTAPEGVAVMTDITKYLDFVLKMFFAFGLTFEIPVATVLLVWAGIATPQSLAAKRPYIIVGAFTLGMLLTPPDVFSQTLMAIPMILLFEAGLLVSKLVIKYKSDSAAEEDADGEAPLETLPMAPAASGDDAGQRYSWEDELHDGERQRPLTPEEMDAELDRIEADEAAARQDKPGGPTGA